MIFRLIKDPENFYREYNNDKIIVKSTGKAYDCVGFFFEKRAKVKLNGKYGFIDTSGREICEIKYDYVEDFHNGIAEVELGEKVGCINRYGVEICPPIYDDACYLEPIGVICLFKDDKVALRDEDGGELCPFIYDEIDMGSCTENFLAVCVNDEWGFVDKNGNEVCEFKFEDVFCAVQVKYNGEWLPLYEVELDEQEYGLIVEIDGELKMIEEL